MSTIETVAGFLGAGGGLSGITAIVKSWLDKSEVKRKLDDVETKMLPEFRDEMQRTIADFKREMVTVLAQVPSLERRATEAIVKLEAAVRAAQRISRSGTGEHAQVGTLLADVASLRREVDALRNAMDAMRLAQPAWLQRLDAIERRFTSFEEAYHDDYGELREKVAGFAGEFKQAMRGGGRHARPATDSE